MVASRRSTCPVACTLDILGDKWTLLVIRDLFLGKQRYDEFLASPEGISTNILAERLKRLEEAGLVAREPYGTHPGRMAYSLTERGRSLRPVMRAVVEWGLANIPNTRLLPGLRAR
ncbi:MAG: helix-turn-helix domain-containing protein [Myxococcota bacterium]